MATAALLYLLGTFGAFVVAAFKNRNAVIWLLIGAFFPVVGLLVLLTLPALGQCPHCRKRHEKGATVCPFCRNELPRKILHTKPIRKPKGFPVDTSAREYLVLGVCNGRTATISVMATTTRDAQDKASRQLDRVDSVTAA